MLEEAIRVYMHVDYFVCVHMVCNYKEELVGEISARLILMLNESVKTCLVMDIVVYVDITLGDFIYVLQDQLNINQMHKTQ